jgi:outer membrane protein TolC
MYVDLKIIKPRIFGLCQKIFLLFFSLSLIINPSNANDLFNKNLYNLVLDTPEVIEAKENLALSDNEITLIASQTKPKINFSTSGNYPFSTNIAPQNNRISNIDETYIDGKISLDTQIYDFGTQNYLIEAEQLKKNAQVINLKILEQEIYFDLIKTGFEILALSDKIDLLKKHTIKHNEDRAVAKERFIKGTGTNLEVKEAELAALNLESEYSKLNSNLAEREKYFETQFGEDFENYSKDFLNLKKLNPKAVISYEMLETLNIKKLKYELQSLQAEVLSIEKSRLPVVSSSLSLNMYNMDNGVGNDYSVTGGINMSVPLYDSGTSKANEKAILIKTKIIRSQIVKQKKKWEKDWNNNTSQILQLRKEILLLSQKKKETLNKSEQLASLSKALQSNFIEVMKTKVDLRLIEREIMNLKEELLQSYIENLFLREQLLTGIINDK